MTDNRHGGPPNEEDTQVALSSPGEFGSDLIVDAMVAAGIEDAVINPGASTSGLHESIERSGLDLHLALHENVAMAMADGYARVTGKLMAVILHNLVGLQSGTMGIFNAWVNQTPVCIYGGAGPESWAKRRPWIDWIHSAKPQTMGANNIVKWHAQPADLTSAVQAVRKGHRIASLLPEGPTYVALDVAIQESKVGDDLDYSPTAHVTADFDASPQTTEELAGLLHNAKKPVIVADLVGRTDAGFASLRALAELIGAPVIDLAGRHNFDTRHELNATRHRKDVLACADLVLALDCRDLGYAILDVGHRDESHGRIPASDALIVDVSMRSQIVQTFVDYSSYEEDAHVIVANTETFLPRLVEVLRSLRAEHGAVNATRWWTAPVGTSVEASQAESGVDSFGLSLKDLAAASWDGLKQEKFVVANGDLRGWLHSEWGLTDRLAFLGKNMGAGLGYGSGAASGAAIGLRRIGSDAIVVNFQNDGDFLYTPQALWTQARYELPVLTFIVNNGSYGQDRRHSERLAELRGRKENARPEGIDFDHPRIDFASIARAQGVRAWGPVGNRESLSAAISSAVRTVIENRTPALVDVTIVHETRLVTL